VHIAGVIGLFAAALLNGKPVTRRTVGFAPPPLLNLKDPCVVEDISKAIEAEPMLFVRLPGT
jgi:hypothetical protein